MESLKYTYWRDEDMWLGYLNEYPDYWTQGETLEELEENLTDVRHFAPPKSPEVPRRGRPGGILSGRARFVVPNMVCWNWLSR